jgi:hypothetical protein
MKPQLRSARSNTGAGLTFGRSEAVEIARQELAQRVTAEVPAARATMPKS